MAYDPTKESPRITIINGYEIFERPEGGFRILDSDGPIIDLTFPAFEKAKNYAETLEPGPRSR